MNIYQKFRCVDEEMHRRVKMEAGDIMGINYDEIKKLFDYENLVVVDDKGIIIFLILPTLVC